MNYIVAAPCCRFVALLLVLLISPAAGHAGSPDRTAEAETECIQKLQAIGRALDAYQREHGHLPDQLSDLIPKYLADKSLLQCPADDTPGDLGSTEAHTDPRMSISYSYERSGDVSNGLPRPLGLFPESDIPGASWGSWRLVNGHQSTFFGDQVPIVRCFHHRPSQPKRDDGAADNVLNLTLAGKVYHSGVHWEEAPPTVAVMLANFDRDVHALAPPLLLKRWLLWRVREYCAATALQATADEACRVRMRSLAPRLAELAPLLPDEQRVTCHLAAGFFAQTKQYARMLPLLDLAAKYPGAEWSPIVEDQMRAEAYHGLKQYDKEIGVYQSLLERRPDVHSYMLSLADVYETTGQKAKAQMWRDKADPGALLVGKAAPDFTVALLDGTTFHLKDALAGKKAILVNFWFCGCAPCRHEFPHLEAWYAQWKASGLELVSVNHGDTTDNVHRFVEEMHATFKIGLGRNPDGSAAPIFDSYHVSLYPTSFLIDSTGKIVWRGVGLGPDLLKELPQALVRLGIK